MKSLVRLWVVMLVALPLGGCSLFAVADAAVTVVATTVSVTAKVVGAGVDAVIPDEDDEDDENKEDK